MSAVPVCWLDEFAWTREECVDSAFRSRRCLAMTARFPFVLVASISAATVFAAEPVQDWRLAGTMPAPEAHQAAAVDGEFVYAITSRAVAKYVRKSGKRIAVSTGEARHLNSGFVHEGRLLCAHSNYPLLPERSEIKSLDPKTMKLTTFHDFKDYGGSLTWVIRRDGQWWCNFAKYGEENAETFLARFDDEWIETGRWTYPSDVIRQLGQYSLSGGLWRGDTLLTTDHDNGRLYRLRLPESGNVLESFGTHTVPFTGQGFAIDSDTKGLVGINRAKKLIVFVEPPVSEGGAKLTTRQTSQKPRPAGIVWVNPPTKELPTGMTHRTFHSEAAGREVGYCVYLPPGYEKSEARCPVIYNLHGNGGNEVHSLEDVALLHEGIVDGRWPPMILVLPNGGHNTFYKDSFDGRFPIETMLIRELIPYIDQNFRTIAARQGRCIEGFSMGGRGSTRLAMKYPDMFCSLFCQAGNVPRTSENFDPTMPDVYPNSYLGPDKENYLSNDAFVLLERNLDRIKGRLRIQIACGTKDGGHLPTIRDFHQALVKHDVDHTYIEMEGLGHRRTEMIDRRRKIWFDYHVESIRRAGQLNE